MLEKLNKSFQEVTDVRLNNVSQLKLFDLFKDIENNEKLLNIFKSYILSDEINNAVFYILHETDNNEWWENIAYRYYGAPYLWWIIPMMNEVLNPFEYLQPGIILKILKPAYLYQLMKEIRTIGNL